MALDGTPWNRLTAARRAAERATLPVGKAHAAWNAGFSRHSPPQAGGGTDLIRRDGSAASTNAPGVTTNRPRPYGPLCRLKPAFPTGGVITAVVPPAVGDG